MPIFRHNALVFFLCFLANSGFSEEKTQNSPSTSARNREGKQLETLLRIAPLFPFNIGLGIGYFANPNTIIEVDVSQGALSIFSSGTTYKSYAVASKFFHGRTFYTSIGINSRHFSYSEKINGEDYKEIAHNSATGLEFYLGNQWQWSNFTLGCDWVGAFVPLLKGGQSHSTDSRLSDNDLNFGRRSQIMVTRFYIGSSF